MKSSRLSQGYSVEWSVAQVSAYIYHLMLSEAP